MSTTSKVWPGLLAGAAAGVAASWVMNQFQSAIAERVAGISKGHGAQSVREGGPASYERKPRHEAGDDPATKTAAAVAEWTTGEPLHGEERRRAGVAAHYAFGASMGALYGAAVEAWPNASAGAGIPFGLSVWVGADQIAVPALGLSKKPDEYPEWIRWYSIAAHAVYGLTTELARRGILRALHAA
ncbi:MAG: DUF1440 domain-containing protein [Proteobacteria bacterium]|nr:DUF1440 domain-containing protein [Pseudomonadota bacterium]